MSELAADSKPRVGHGFRLQWEEAQSAYVLLYPEGMVQLNPSAAEIDTFRNRALAEERLAGKVRSALYVPRTRRATKPTRGSQRRRVEAKKQRGETKRSRRPPSPDD